MQEEIIQYNNAQTDRDKAICELLFKQLTSSLPKSESKIWHGAPVWFIDGNPIVGYDVLKDCVRLLFWSGQSFDEPVLQPEGKFKAAEVRYTNADQINIVELKKWLHKAEKIQWDYKNIVKKRGVLDKLK